MPKHYVRWGGPTFRLQSIFALMHLRIYALPPYLQLPFPICLVPTAVKYLLIYLHQELIPLCLVHTHPAPPTNLHNVSIYPLQALPIQCSAPGHYFVIREAVLNTR